MVNELAKFQLQPTTNRRESWRSEMETRRKAIYRDCPRGLVLDREHALARVGGSMVTGGGAVMARRYLIRGLLGDGFSYDEVAEALAASADEMRRAQGQLPIHEPGVKQLAELRAAMPRSDSPVLDQERSEANTERRQGNLLRGSRGWKTPPEYFPQTTTPPHK